MTTYVERRWIGYERCPSGDGIHVLPVTLSSSAPLSNIETPGNITAAEPCPDCRVV